MKYNYWDDVATKQQLEKKYRQCLGYSDRCHKKVYGYSEDRMCIACKTDNAIMEDGTENYKNRNKE